MPPLPARSERSWAGLGWAERGWAGLGCSAAPAPSPLRAPPGPRTDLRPQPAAAPRMRHYPPRRRLCRWGRGEEPLCARQRGSVPGPGRAEPCWRRGCTRAGLGRALPPSCLRRSDACDRSSRVPALFPPQRRLFLLVLRWGRVRQPDAAGGLTAARRHATGSPLPGPSAGRRARLAALSRGAA